MGITATYLDLRSMASVTPYRWLDPDAHSVASSFPHHSPQTLVSGELAAGWGMEQAILVTIERDEDGCYVISDEVFFVYGDGPTFALALQDYRRSLLDYYELVAAGARENAFDQALLRRLNLYIGPTDR